MEQTRCRPRQPTSGSRSPSRRIHCITIFIPRHITFLCCIRRRSLESFLSQRRLPVGVLTRVVLPSALRNCLAPMVDSDATGICTHSSLAHRRGSGFNLDTWPFDLSAAMGNEFVGDNKLGEYSRGRRYFHREPMRMTGGRSRRLVPHRQGCA